MNSIRPFKEFTPKLGKQVFVDDSAVVIGDVVLGDNCSVWPQAVIRGDMHRIRIGARSSIQDGSILHITHAGPFNEHGWPLLVGEEVTIGHRAVLHGCEIGSQVLVGNGAIVMDGAVVENHVIIGANTLVPPGKHLPSGYLYIGSPCRQARQLTEKERLFFSYTASNYVNLKNDHIEALNTEITKD